MQHVRFFYLHIICFTLVSGMVSQADAQPEQFRFKQISIYDGLSHNQVNCILRDERGFMWFATPSGLNRFDGYTFKIFHHDLKDTTTLDENYVTDIFKLPQGKLWVKTRGSSNIYDPQKETFDRNFEAYLATLSLPGGTITRIKEDRNGNFWFLYKEKGIYSYTPATHQTVPFRESPEQDRTSNSQVADIGFGKDGLLWIIYQDGRLEQIDKTSRVLYRNDFLRSVKVEGTETYKLFRDTSGDLWIYIPSSNNGLYFFDNRKRAFLHSGSGTKFHLNNEIVNGVVEDGQGRIWVGTDHGGLNLIDKSDFSVHYLINNPEDSRSLAQNSIYSLYKDEMGFIWIGTYKRGVSYFHEMFNRFPLYRRIPQDKHSLPYDDVNCFVEDEKGNLWIGTNGGGLIYFDTKKNAFRRYLHSNDLNSLSSNVIVSLHLDKQDQLWIGTYMGGLDYLSHGIFTHYRHVPGDDKTISNNSVWDILRDTGGRLWVATLGGGLEFFDPETQSFTRHQREQKIEGQEYVMSLMEDEDEKLWIGTSAGIEVFEPQTGAVRFFMHRADDSTSLSNDNVNYIFQDSKRRIWVGTREGLNLFYPGDQHFRTFLSKDGLPGNTILSIQEDAQGRIWLGTPNGLSCLTIAMGERENKFSFKNYNEADGLQARNFNEKSAYKTRDGLLLFGGPNGFNMFDPGSLRQDQYFPEVVFTDLQVFSRSIGIGEKLYQKVILPRAISEAEKITIPHQINDFSISFAAMGSVRIERNKYEYKLAGFNNNWIIPSDGSHTATYTNLRPGTYTFLVRTANNDGLWSPHESALQIRILPPFWLTYWAFLLYTAFVAGLLYLGRSLLLYRARMRFRIAQQEREAQHRHELDMMKIRFFTNVSHEFRTPLTLILSPLERLLKNTAEPQQQSQLQLVWRNANRLLHLVNQLLDFRKLEVQEIRLHLSHRDIVPFIKEVVSSFSDLSEKKDVQLSIKTNIQSLKMDFDPNKMERILYNLLSNAFKFTQERGHIEVLLDLENSKGPEKKNLIVRVKDDGIGIPLEKQGHIFERFFQHENALSAVNPGNGIGLSITSEFVRLHGGKISVNSTPRKGSCFVITLPVSGQESLLREGHTEMISPVTEDRSAADTIKKRHKYKVLLVEDNEDFRFYLKDNLSVYFNMEEAGDGKAGWEQVMASKPDLVVCDIMMPGMNGIELAKRIKKDPRTAGIPIILLTARTMEDQKLEGYETGANDYITKPFNFEILLARIRNLLEERERIRKSAPPKVPILPAELELTPESESFLKQVSQVVEENMMNPDFSVKALSDSLYMNRVTLYKRVLQLTGKTPVAFIRIMRLERAAQLIKEGEIGISQAAYKVGFNNPKYFTRYFKEQFGILPSEYAKKEN